jgi:hypothetical protein
MTCITMILVAIGSGSVWTVAVRAMMFQTMMS